jgi:hypothetical protein
MRRKKFERKRKTYAEVIARQDEGEIYLDEETGIQLLMSNPAPAYAMGELLMRFYQANEGLRPITFQMLEEGGESLPQKDWYAIMYRSWHIRIVLGSETGGPHQTQLWFKSQSMRKAFWVATLQLMAFYYNKNEVLEALLTAIENKEFFISDTDRDIIITV